MYPERPITPHRELLPRASDSGVGLPPSRATTTTLAQSQPDIAFRRRPAGLAWLGWTVSIVVVAFLVWAGYNFRADVMRAWPPSQRLYVVLGLGPAPPPPASTPNR